jgi:CBS domain-containing protein
MAKSVREVMTRNPVAMPADASVQEAAKAMSDMRIGAIVIMDGNKPTGIVTDRDITVRAVATGSDPAKTKLKDIASERVAAVRPDQSVDDAAQVMKSNDVRRVLVVSDSKLEGIVSLGDLSREGRDQGVERDISRSEPNN